MLAYIVQRVSGDIRGENCTDGVLVVAGEEVNICDGGSEAVWQGGGAGELSTTEYLAAK